jgi:hypothetical protein
MAAAWIARLKQAAADAEREKQETARRAGVITAKSPDWFRRFTESATAQVAEVVAELQKRVEVAERTNAKLTARTAGGYPYASVTCDLDAAAQCVRVTIIRKLTAASESKEKTDCAEFSVNADDSLIVTFYDQKHFDPCDFASHVLEFALYGTHPAPAQNLNLGMS